MKRRISNLLFKKRRHKVYKRRRRKFLIKKRRYKVEGDLKEKNRKVAD